MQSTDELKKLIETAGSICGSEYKLAKRMGIPQQMLTDWKAARRTCSPTDRAILAGIAGLDAQAELVRATLEREQGSRRGDMLEALLGPKAQEVTEAAKASPDPARAALEAIADMLKDRPEARQAIMAVMQAFPIKTTAYINFLRTGMASLQWPCNSFQMRSATV